MNPISYKLSGIAHIAPTIGRDPYKNPSSIPDCNLILPKDTPDVAVSTVGFSLGASQIQETVKQLFA